MRPQTFIAALAACVLALPALATDMPAAPYTGQQARTIKALPVEDVAALRKGEGMGMAKAAELNGYPGPAHVLALARQLSLYWLRVFGVAALGEHERSVENLELARRCDDFVILLVGN